MRVNCQLRALRGERKLREFETETGINRGYLSLYERGRAFPPDHQVKVMERVYGAPASAWYGAHVLVDLTTDDGRPIAAVST